MKEIIFTIISVMNAIVFLIFVPRRIFTLSKRLEDTYANTEYMQFLMSKQLPNPPSEMIARKIVFEREKFKISGACFLQLLIALGSLYLSGLEWVGFKAFTAMTGVFDLAICVAVFVLYWKIEKRYQFENVDHRADFAAFLSAFIVALPIYQTVLLFL